MKLHAVHGPAAVAQAHDHAVLARPRADLEVGRQPLFVHDERVIPRRRERLGQAREDTAAVVLDRRGLPVQRRHGAHDPTAEHGADGLMAEAHAENGRRLAEVANDAHRHAGLFGAARPRGDHDALRRIGGERLERHGVVAHHADLRAQLAEVLHEVVGERIVVVDHEDHLSSYLSRGPTPVYKPACAISSARSRAFALSRVSSYSAAGLESITMPAPACTYALPADMITVRIAMQKSRLPAKSR